MAKSPSIKMVMAGGWFTGWWYTYPSETYESQLGLLFPIEWKVIKFHGSSHHQSENPYVCLSTIVVTLW